MIMRSHVFRERLSLRPFSSESAIDCSIDFVRNRFNGLHLSQKGAAVKGKLPRQAY
jgi:hypothetical protein